MYDNFAEVMLISLVFLCFLIKKHVQSKKPMSILGESKWSVPVPHFVSDFLRKMFHAISY